MPPAATRPEETSTMPTVKGCNLPDELLYDVENQIWFKEVDDGNVRIGMTAVATAMAGKLVAFTPKGVGKEVKAGKSCATVESGKWVGPAKTAAGGTVVAVNDALAVQQGPHAALAVVGKGHKLHRIVLP